LTRRTMFRIGGAAALVSFLFLGIAQGEESKARSAKAWFDTGMLLREAGKPDSSDAFKRAVQELDTYIGDKEADQTGRASAYSLRARCQNLLGDNNKAISDLNKAVELSPEDADAYYLRSFVYGLTGNARMSLADQKAAARKGHKKAQGDLTAKGIEWESGRKTK
jgi:tetratricopeptide (TPR) repeat protein